MMGRYELLRPLARGGMAEVFLARRRGPGGVEKRLVVKRIRRERARDPRFVEMFVREAQLSMSLAHKNIVPVFDFGRAGSELFLVMEYINGLDLATLLELAATHERPLDPLLAAFIAIEACQGLDYAHGRRDDDGNPQPVIHRDVTPRNVLLSEAGEVKLVDFGLATTEVDAGGGKVRGTPAYMAPEQARGERVDGRSDTFSLGLILWEILAGRRAYGARGQENALAQARAGDVAPLPDQVPEELCQIVEQAIRRDPAGRFASARTMQMALDGYAVSARARLSGDRAMPPGHQVAEWVRALIGQQQESQSVEVADLPDGDVVTFLEEGDLDRITAADATMRSLAETVVETEESIAGSDADADADADAASDARMVAVREAKRRTLAWLSAGVIAATLVIATVWRVQSPETRTEVQEPDTSAASTLATSEGDRGTATADEPSDVPVAQSQDTEDERAVSSPGDSPPLASSNDRITRAIVKPAGASDSVKPARPSRSPAKNTAQTTSGDDPADQGDRARDLDGAAGAQDSQKNDAMGFLRISSSPWARVTIVGRPETCRDTPCQLSLPPGTYSLTLHNPVKNVGKSISVKVIAGETATIREILTRAP